MAPAGRPHSVVLLLVARPTVTLVDESLDAESHHLRPGPPPFLGQRVQPVGKILRDLPVYGHHFFSRVGSARLAHVMGAIGCAHYRRKPDNGKAAILLRPIIY